MKQLTFTFLLSCTFLVACGDDDGMVDATVDMTVLDMNTVPDTDLPEVSTPDADASTQPDATVNGMCPPGPCDLIANGCAQGQGCFWLVPAGGGDPAPTCAEAGTKAEGDDCETYSECQEGHTCSEGKCTKFCCGGSDVGCPNGRTCSIALSGSDSQGGLCVAPDNCDILAQTGCQDMEGCYPNGDGTTVCAGAGDTALGAMCEFNNDCGAGATCISTAETDPVCRAFCDPMADDACTDGFSCAGLNGLEGIGVCVPSA